MLIKNQSDLLLKTNKQVLHFLHNSFHDLFYSSFSTETVMHNRGGGEIGTPDTCSPPTDAGVSAGVGEDGLAVGAGEDGLAESDGVDEDDPEV